MKNITVIEGERQIVLYSYNTPVASYDKDSRVVRKTSKKHSTTTSKHISYFFNEYLIPKYLRAFNPVVVPQEYFDNKFTFKVVPL